MARAMGLPKCVEGFLQLVVEPPEKMPKQQYRQREIEAEIRGFNKAQEKLREVIEFNGTDAIKSLAEVREEGQQRPQRAGNLNLWVT